MTIRETIENLMNEHTEIITVRLYDHTLMHTFSASYDQHHDRYNFSHETESDESGLYRVEHYNNVNNFFDAFDNVPGTEYSIRRGEHSVYIRIL